MTKLEKDFDSFLSENTEYITLKPVFEHLKHYLVEIDYDGICFDCILDEECLNISLKTYEGLTISITKRKEYLDDNMVSLNIFRNRKIVFCGVVECENIQKITENVKKHL